MRRLMIVSVAAAVAAGLVGRRATRNWGTTPVETATTYAGDDLLSAPVDQAMYGVSVDAPASVVWSWLVQIGQDRGGMYSYERLENLFGLEIRNAEEIRPEWQNLAVGDQVRVVPPGRLGMPSGYAFRVALVDPPRALVLRQQPPEHPWDSTWAFLIIPTGAASCRLLSRSRTVRQPGTAATLARWSGQLMTPVIFLMTRRMLLTLKARAEGSK